MWTRHHSGENELGSDLEYEVNSNNLHVLPHIFSLGLTT